MNERRTKAHWKATIDGKEYRFEYDPKTEILQVWQKFRFKHGRFITAQQLVEAMIGGQTSFRL